MIKRGKIKFMHRFYVYEYHNGAPGHYPYVIWSFSAIHIYYTDMFPSIILSTYFFKWFDIFVPENDICCKNWTRKLLVCRLGFYEEEIDFATSNTYTAIKWF